MDNLKKLFAMHYNMLLQQHSELIIALRRFSMAMNRDVVADKLLDLMVSAEALFLEGSAELNYRLAVRAAALLGKDSAEKESIYKFFKEMYKIRSKLVHGQMTFKDFAKFYEKHEADIDLLSRYIRESLLKLTELALSNPNKKPLVEWERMLFQKY
jgi:malate synthase